MKTFSNYFHICQINTTHNRQNCNNNSNIWKSCFLSHLLALAWCDIEIHLSVQSSESFSTNKYVCIRDLVNLNAYHHQTALKYLLDKLNWIAHYTSDLDLYFTSSSEWYVYICMSTLMLSSSQTKVVRVQRSEIDTIKYHT